MVFIQVYSTDNVIVFSFHGSNIEIRADIDDPVVPSLKVFNNSKKKYIDKYFPIPEKSKHRLVYSIGEPI